MAHRWNPTAPHVGKLVLPVRIDPSGVKGPTAAQARGPHWRRTSHGFYVPTATRDDLPEQRVAEASVRLPPHARITGWAACRLNGANFFDGLERDGRTQLPVPVNVGPRGQITTRCRILLRYAVPGVHWLVNCPIYDLSGRLLGIADLIDLEAGLVVEFDGADHRQAARHTRDVVKEDALRRVGLEVVRVTGREVDNHGLVGDRVRAGRERARFECEVDRRWLARPPSDTLHEVIEERTVLRSLAESG